MRARDLVERIPTVTRDTTALEAARVVAEYRLTALVVADDAGVPMAVVPATQMMRLVVPKYVRDDPSLAHVYDEVAAEELCGRLAEETVAGLLDDPEVTSHEVPSVLPQDTLIEIAMAMVQSQSPVILVRDRDKRYHGVVTFSRTMAAIASTAGARSQGLQRRLENDLVAPDEPSAGGSTGEEPIA